MIRPFFLAALLLTLGVFPLAGQGNQPSKPIPQAERERLFKAGLKLDPPPKGAIELVLKRRIPTDEEMEAKEIHLRSVHNFSVDDRGHIFLPEYTFTAIYEFDAEGRLLHKFDKKGRGPGELTKPNQVWFFNGQIVVNDGGPMRINFYDRDWRFARSFQYYKYRNNFIVGKNNLFYAVNLRDDYLIDIIDSSGKGLDSFGALPSKKGSMLNRAILGLSPDGSVWVGLNSIAKLKKYSPQGILQKEIDLLPLLSRKLKDQYKQSIDWDKKGEQKSYFLLQAISFFGNDLLVQAGGLIHPIYRFNSAGAIVKTYYIQPGRHYISYDGICARLGKNGEEEFLILKNDYEEGDVRIGVYSPKHAKQ